MNDNKPKPVFCYARQRPTQAPDRLEHLGPIDYRTFVEIVRSIDWRREANQAEWLRKALPTIAVTNQDDHCTFWVYAVVAGSIIDVDCEPDEQLRTDASEPWFTTGLENAPDIPNVVSISKDSSDDNLGFTTASLDSVEECFEWFFEEDYESLYSLFRWV